MTSLVILSTDLKSSVLSTSNYNFIIMISLHPINGCGHTNHTHIIGLVCMYVWPDQCYSACYTPGVYVCVSLTTVEATLIYSAKNQHQWTANGILFILKKLKFRKSAPLIQKQPSKLTALYRTSYGHAHLLKFKVHFKGKCMQC